MEVANLMNKQECWVDVYVNTDDVCIADNDGNVIGISHADAIAAARAILKHFQVVVESDQ